MTARTTARSILKHARWLCALALVGCDDPDVELAEDEAQDAIIIADSELREVCDLAGLDSQPLAPSHELDLLLPLCMSLPPGADNPDLTDAPQVAEGVCQGEWETKFERTNCNTCVVAPGNSGTLYHGYRRWCYKPPNPVACGGCGSWEYTGPICHDFDLCT
ncbi:hypothetical protein [Nannocystis radixulma]|uniref:Lipoprotein n=1 Tax=Nannocystis radixulma TaxID=2995305 RepID=A0ABT5BSW3_9BACT|nr:hypothetical protein [Nannocystis radixulma]MDC0676072.1 hypothetical protein [Nannocystis radixulma]